MIVVVAYCCFYRLLYAYFFLLLLLLLNATLQYIFIYSCVSRVLLSLLPFVRSSFHSLSLTLVSQFGLVFRFHYCLLSIFVMVFISTERASASCGVDEPSWFSFYLVFILFAYYVVRVFRIYFIYFSLSPYIYTHTIYIVVVFFLVLVCYLPL